MKRFKKLLTLCVLGLICFAATGCGEMTAEKLASKMNAAAIGKQVTYAEMSMDLEASYAMSAMGTDMDIDMVMGMDLDMWVNAEPFAGYSEGHLTMNVMGQDIDTDIKAHTVIEDDQIVTYNYVGMTDSWSREDTGLSSSQYEDFLLTAPAIGSDSTEFTMDEETTDLDGKEVYVLHLNYTGEDMEKIFSETASFNAMMDIPENSMDNITVPATAYVDVNTFLTVQIEMDIEGMEEFVNAMMAQELENSDEDMEDSDISVEVGKCHVVMKNFSYDVQNIPDVPQDAKDTIALAEALENADTTLPDGRYLLKYESNAVALSEIDGYTVNITSAGNAELYSDNGMQMISITGVPTVMSEYIVSEMLSNYDTLFSSVGVTLEKSDVPETVSTHLGDAEAYWMGTEGLNLYYSVIQVGGMEVFILAADMTGEWQQAEDIMIPATDAISEITLEDLQ